MFVVDFSVHLSNQWTANFYQTKNAAPSTTTSRTSTSSSTSNIIIIIIDGTVQSFIPAFIVVCKIRANSLMVGRLRDPVPRGKKSNATDDSGGIDGWRKEFGTGQPQRWRRRPSIDLQTQQCTSKSASPALHYQQSLLQAAGGRAFPIFAMTPAKYFLRVCMRVCAYMHTISQHVCVMHKMMMPLIENSIEMGFKYMLSISQTPPPSAIHLLLHLLFQPFSSHPSRSHIIITITQVS